MKSNDRTEESFLNRHLLVLGMSVLVIGVLAVVFAPYFFTQLSGAYDLSDKGQIGDAISGTTAPIVGLVGAILVFLSLFAQIQANRLVLREFREERGRYDTEKAQRELDRKDESRKEQFRTVIELVRNQNDDFSSLAAYDENGHLKTGSEAVRVILRKKFNGAESEYFPLLELIAKNLIAAADIVEQFELRPDQKTIAGNQILGVATKIRVLLNRHPNLDNPLSKLHEFDILVATVETRALELIEIP